MQYRHDKTPVATKNLASELTSADISTALIPLVVFTLHTCSPNLNGYSIE